jgi:hypothetical protein
MLFESCRSSAEAVYRVTRPRAGLFRIYVFVLMSKPTALVAPTIANSESFRGSTRRKKGLMSA